MRDVPESGDVQAAPPKEDPETLVLRGTPRAVVRFRRGLIIGLTGAVAACLVTVAWLALEPPGFRLAAGEDRGGDPFRKAAPDALANAPSSYGDVPRLGPPLPGDLGRPILEHQRSLAAPASPPVPEGPAREAERARAAAEAKRQRLAAAREAARMSGVVVPLQRGSEAAAQGRPAPDVASGPAAAPPPRQAGAGVQATGSTSGGAEAGDANVHPFRPAPSPWTLSAGTIIPASLVTGLNSDLPGTVFAQVTENVRDSATGRTVLIPQGARLIGSYDNVVAFGQRRAMLVWQRIVLPDGSSVRLDDFTAADPSGYSGLEDRVDFHTWRLLKGIALSTLLGVGSELSLGSTESDLVRAVREATQQNGARAGEQVVSRNLDIQPTIRVRPGWPLRAIVHKDLVLQPWKG